MLRRLDGDVETRVLRVRLVELDRAGEVGKAAAHFAQQVAHLERDFRMAAIDLERADGGGDGGLGGHVGSPFESAGTRLCLHTLRV